MEVSCYAAFEQAGALKDFKYEPKPLGDSQIEIEISHCGICHSDIHLIDNGLGITKYPFVPGHEIIGTIKTVGSRVHNFKVGDRVGVGWQSGSCGECEFCEVGDQNLCAKMESTCVTQYGGYAKSFRVNANFAVLIPAKIDSRSAAPLMCGGVTVYQPLCYYEVEHQMRVGVVGIGGLGHLALQFLNGFGCEVTAFSTSKNKEPEAKTLGAHHFVDSSDLEAMKKHANSYDFILSTASSDLDSTPYFTALKPKGKLCLVGLGTKAVAVPNAPLVFGQRLVGGSWIGSPRMIRQMLSFIERSGTKVITEAFPMPKLNDAIKKVRDNKVRYRAVLEN